MTQYQIMEKQTATVKLEQDFFIDMGRFGAFLIGWVLQPGANCRLPFSRVAVFSQLTVL
jgi:hypothetical protein